MDGQWIDISADVLPKVDLSLFINENYKFDMEMRRTFLESIEFVYRLPRTGTTLSVKIDLDRFISGTLNVDQRTNKERMTQAAKKIIDNIKYQEIKLIWDTKTNKFNIGKKILFKPSDRINNYLNRRT